MGLVVAEIVARPDIDEAHGELLGEGPVDAEVAGERAARDDRRSLEQAAAGDGGTVRHSWLLCVVR